jgi:hypothetical protein
MAARCVVSLSVIRRSGRVEVQSFVGPGAEYLVEAVAGGEAEGRGCLVGETGRRVARRVELGGDAPARARRRILR